MPYLRWLLEPGLSSVVALTKTLIHGEIIMFVGVLLRGLEYAMDSIADWGDSWLAHAGTLRAFSVKAVQGLLRCIKFGFFLCSLILLLCQQFYPRNHATPNGTPNAGPGSCPDPASNDEALSLLRSRLPALGARFEPLHDANERYFPAHLEFYAVRASIVDDLLGLRDSYLTAWIAATRTSVQQKAEVETRAVEKQLSKLDADVTACRTKFDELRGAGEALLWALYDATHRTQKEQAYRKEQTQLPRRETVQRRQGAQRRHTLADDPLQLENDEGLAAIKSLLNSMSDLVSQMMRRVKDPEKLCLQEQVATADRAWEASIKDVGKSRGRSKHQHLRRLQEQSEGWVIPYQARSRDLIARKEHSVGSTRPHSTAATTPSKVEKVARLAPPLSGGTA